MNKPDINKLLSTKIKKSKLFIDSLTHRSAGNKNNERLEFFGDAILGFFISELLYTKFSNDDEGLLSRKRSYLVRKETLSKIAVYYNIGSQIILGEGERKSGGQSRESIISDALEALIAVVYIEDGADVTREFIYNIFHNFIDSLPEDEELKDSKTKLQELLQSNNSCLPEYDTIEIYKNNKTVFQTVCKIDIYNIIEYGEGNNKRNAQQDAASKALEKIKKKCEK